MFFQDAKGWKSWCKLSSQDCLLYKPHSILSSKEIRILFCLYPVLLRVPITLRNFWAPKGACFIALHGWPYDHLLVFGFFFRSYSIPSLSFCNSTPISPTTRETVLIPHDQCGEGLEANSRVLLCPQEHGRTSRITVSNPRRSPTQEAGSGLLNQRWFGAEWAPIPCAFMNPHF